MDELVELEKALRAATPAPWRVTECAAGIDGPGREEVVTWGHDDGGVTARADAEAIVALRNAAPSLISEIRRLRIALAAAGKP